MEASKSDFFVWGESLARPTMCRQLITSLLAMHFNAVSINHT
jgi:hypothetical protein